MTDVVRHAQEALDVVSDIRSSLNHGIAPSEAQLSAAEAAGAALRSSVAAALEQPGDLSFVFQDSAHAASTASTAFDHAMSVIRGTDVSSAFGAATASSAVAAYSRQLEPVVSGLSDSPCMYPREFDRHVGAESTSVSDGLRACGREMVSQQMPLQLETMFGATPVSLYADSHSHPCGVYGGGPSGRGACPTHSEANASADSALIDDFPKPAYTGQEFAPWEHA